MVPLVALQYEKVKLWAMKVAQEVKTSFIINGVSGESPRKF